MGNSRAMVGGLKGVEGSGWEEIPCSCDNDTNSFLPPQDRR